jgi:hypothetical protein
MIKVTTIHGSQYLIDLENYRAMRINNSGNILASDNMWFNFASLNAYDRNTNTHFYDDPYIIGKSLYFSLIGIHSRDYDWRISTDVVSVEEI